MKRLAQSLKNLKKRWVWMVALLVSAAPAWAAMLTVTNPADGGAGSLRALIASANSGDTIGFANGMTIRLTSGALVIKKRLIINAIDVGGAAIDGGGLTGADMPVFVITNSAIVDFFDITVTNGANFLGSGVGGGIDVESGSLLLFGCTVSGNQSAASGGGIFCNTGATLFLENGCTVSGNFAYGEGGGIEVGTGSSASVLNSTVSGNTGQYGGGIFNGGSLILANSTVSGNNSSNYPGGGIFNAAPGFAALTNCTVSGNFAIGEGNGINNQYTMILNNCTISGNSGGIYGSLANMSGPTALMMTNTVVAGNVPSDLDGLYSGVNNLVGGDPKLAPLRNYGGALQTMVPLYGSPLIDAGTDSVTSFLTTDERGSPRRSGAHVDIGAAEAQFGSSSNPPLLKSIVRSGTNFFFFNFANVPNVDFTALMSTNPGAPLSNWTTLGAVLQVSPGSYQFLDAGATNGAEFYRVVSP